MNFWISFWVQDEHLQKFEYHGPWWITGYSIGCTSICAAVRADNEMHSKAIMCRAFDEKPLVSQISWRFCEPRPDDWEPFGSRFPRGDWMIWPWPKEAE
jgi:hypothetical protein